MELPQTLINQQIKDVIISPKGGCMLFYLSGKMTYIPSQDYAIKASLINSQTKCHSSLDMFKKKRRDTKVLLKYILPDMFKRLKLNMPSYSSLKLPKFEEEKI